jgi:hypothetical protein
LTDYIDDYLNDPQIMEQMFQVGREGYADKGRGVVVIDLRRFAQNVVRFYYLSADQENGWGDREMEEVCQLYNPEREVIVFLFFGEFSPKNDSYKVAITEG